MVGAGTVIIAVLSAGFGAIVSILITRRHSPFVQTPSLTPYLISHHPILSGLGESISDDLKIEFRGEAVESLNETFVLWGNDGRRPVRDLEDPPEIRFPNSINGFQARLIHSDPSDKFEGTIPNKADGRYVVRTPIGVLNPGEYLILHLVTKGRFDPSEAEYRVRGPDLPNALDLDRDVPFDEGLGWGERVGQALGKFALIGFIFLVAIAFGFAIWQIAQFRPEIFPLIGSSFRFQAIPTILIGLLALIGLVYLILGLVASWQTLKSMFSRAPFSKPPEEVIEV